MCIRDRTEVVLQNFGGTLTMLDSRNSGGGFEAVGGDSGGQVLAQRSGGEIDDEIPF